ncbi:hypothetical protein BGU59_09845 [Clostridioides difficile]|nr:hypothetical protein BGU59_09845 [Clostridioides difficile]
MSFIYRNEKGAEVILTTTKIKVADIKGLDGLKNDIGSVKGYNQHGSTYVSNTIDEREIDISLKIITDDEDYRRIKRNLLSIFNPDTKGDLIVKSVNGERERKISTRVVESPKFKQSKSKYKNMRECEIGLIALDPYWKDKSETKTDIAIWRGKFSFPLVIKENGIIMGYREPSLIVNTKNMGDVKCGMKILFKAKGTLVNPQLVNIETQDFVKINKTMKKGEVIEVTTDFGNKKVSYSRNGVVENAFNYWDLYSTFLQLEVGDNLFRYNADEGIDNLEVTIYHTSRYLGI